MPEAGSRSKASRFERESRVASDARRVTTDEAFVSAGTTWNSTVQGPFNESNTGSASSNSARMASSPPVKQ